MIQQKSPFRRLQFASLVMGLCLFSVACGEGESRNRPSTVGGTRTVNKLPSSTKCEDGAEQECGVTLRQSGGIITCFQGTQICEDGEWGACIDGELSTDDKNASFGRDFEIQALSNAAANDCADICDPKCLRVIEEPPDLGTTTGSGGGGGSSMPADPPSFPGQSEQVACDHDVCSQGAALDSGCDPCVAEICSNHDSSCCSSSWDEACVDLVYTVCLGEPAPANLCDFGLFAESTITAADRPSSGASIGANGNVALGTDATPGKIMTKGNLNIRSPNGGGKTIKIPEGVWVGGNITFQDGSSTTYQADFHVGGGIDLSGGNTISGNAYAQTNITGQNTARILGNAYAGGSIGTYPLVSGTKNSGSGHAPPVISIPAAIPDLPRSCPGGTNYTIDNGTRTLAPGNYGSIRMQNGAKLVLNGEGTYTFTSIDAGSLNGGGIQIGTSAPTTPGGYDVTVCGNLALGNNVNIINYSANPTDQNAKTPVLSNSKYLVTWVGGNASFGTYGKWVGVMIVPNGSFTSSNYTNATGAIWASSVNAGTDLNAVGISASDCNALEIPGIGGASVECSIENVTTGVPPSAVEPCETGADCQINQRCDEVTTGEDCSHDKCVWGEALDASCDSCVGRICALAPDCCADEWTRDCAEMVATVCDATCGAPTAPICWHDICETGEGLAIGCDASEDDCTNTVCQGAFAYCCDTTDPTGWDDACVEQAAIECSGGGGGGGGGGPTLCDYTVTWGTSYSKGGASVSPNTSTNTLTVEDRAITCGAGTTTINSNSTRSAGTYGNIVVGDWGKTLTLNPGTYYINNLTIGPGSTVTIPNGPVILNVCGNISLGQDSKITGLANNSALLGLQIYLEGNFTAGPQAVSRGVLMAANPASTVKLDGPTSHTGYIWSNGRVEFTSNWGSNPTVTNPIAKADCESSGLVATGPTCDVVTPIGEVENGGICVSNTDGWTEPYCSGFDLAADYVCDTDVVPICNHGDTQFSGYVEVGYWEAGAGQFSTSTPNTSASSYDTCGDTLTIAPGTCEDLHCPVPGAGDYTYMVDPEGSLSECNDSRLDNWTWKDGDFVCLETGGAGGVSVVEYEYLADCPGDTVPGWKNLTWKTSVPTGSSITFRAQVVESLSDVDPASYREMGIAQPGTPNTTNCQLDGPTPECPIPLTDKLDLTVNQGRVLALQIETDHSGGTPTVEDWAVSYTCRYDQ